MKKSNWTFLRLGMRGLGEGQPRQQAHKAKLIREEDVDSGNYQGGALAHSGVHGLPRPVHEETGARRRGRAGGEAPATVNQVTYWK